MIEWLRTEVFTEAVRAQSFGADVNKFVSFEPSEQEGTAQLSSDVVFGDVTVEKDDGQRVTESVVVKVQPASNAEVVHTVHDCDAQFHNEVLFYSKVVPLLRKYDTCDLLSTSFCEFLYGNATAGQNPKEDVVVLKNLSTKFFRLTDERIFLDEKHIKLALDRLAKFHALSLKCLAENPAAFDSVVSQIKNTTRALDGTIVPKHLWTLNVFRGMDPLQNDLKYKDKLEDIYKHCERAEFWLEKYRGPSDSLNVVTHGDFCRNNMMFKYDGKGDPVEVVFFDTATIKYGSPAIDMSFFLMLNASPEVRELHWDDFLRTYYDSLSGQLEGHPAKPSFDDVELNLRKTGVYGYYLCSTFLPFVMMHGRKEDFEGENNGEKWTRYLQEAGGSETTECLTAMVKHMLDKNYIFEH